MESIKSKTLIDAFDHSDNLRDQLFNELDICPECGHHHEHHHDHECEHEHHHADEIFTSWGIQTPKNILKFN